jgi:ADP-ribose pyrophosphatase
MRLRVDELELPDGTIVSDYYVRESEGFAVIFPVTQDGRIVLVRQYRYGSDAIHLELPAGGPDAGEDLSACAARELREETGYSAARWEFVGAFYTEPARGSSRAHVFLATDAKQTSEPHPDPTEVMEVELTSFEEFRRMLEDGRIDTGHALVAGYRVLDRLGRL